MHPVAVRLRDHEVEIVDQIRRHLAERNPDLRPTRSDALRYLVSRSGSVLRDLHIAAPAPPAAEQIRPALFRAPEPV